MPFKSNADRRRHIPKQRHRVTNWAEYDAGLRARGSLTVWFAPEAVEAWKAEPRAGRGGQPRYSALAVATALTLRAVFRLSLRQAEGLIGSILALLGLDLAVPDHTTLSRRAETLEVPRPRGGREPVHLLVDSTGLRLCGPGEWLAEKRGTKRRRAWKKLRLATDADTGRIVASALTDKDAADGSQVGSLLDQVDRPVTSLTADGAFDRDDVYAAVAARHPGADVIVPPRSSAVPSDMAETAPTRRDGHLQVIAERGRMGWQRVSGYTTGRLLWSATSPDGSASSATGCAHGRTGVSKPRWPSPPACRTACSTSDARSTSASPDRNTGRAQCAHTVDPCNKVTKMVKRSSKRPQRNPGRTSASAGGSASAASRPSSASASIRCIRALLPESEQVNHGAGPG